MLERYHRRLESQVRSQDMSDELDRLAMTHPIFRKYPTAQRLVELIQTDNRRYADKDAALAAILAELKSAADLFPLLAMMFWKNLKRLYWYACRRHPEPEEVFAQIQAEFYYTAVDYPLRSRPKKIGANLVLDTLKRVTVWLRDENDRRMHIVYSERSIEPVPEAAPPVGRTPPGDVPAFLRSLLAERIIDGVQFEIIMQTRIERQQTLRQWATAHGMNPNTVKTRYYRAKLAVRRYLGAEQP